MSSSLARLRARNCACEPVAHVGGLALAFTAAARKDFGELTDTAARRGRARSTTTGAPHIRRVLQRWPTLGAIPSAWEGMSRAGGVDFPGEVGGIDRADRGGHPRLGRGAATTGQSYDIDDATAAAVLPHVTAIAAAGPVEGLFGPAVPSAMTRRRSTGSLP